jgi:beta-galactosidase
VTGWPTGPRGPCWGGDYNPEQWPEHVWTQDVELMKRAGVNLVSVGIFAWARLEVADNRFDFGWLDQVLDQLHEGGIRVCLANATASPPPWLTAAYGEHPALAAWHVNNEYGCHVSRCYCDRCADVFRDWLRARYDLDGLNRAWGTDFWSQHYSAWDQVLPPRVTPTFQNPGQVLDFARFCSDALLDLFCAERDVLRDVTPDVPVTTNFMVGWTFKALNYWHWAAEVDFVSNDHYTRAADPERHVELALSADLVRGLSRGEPWLLMEHSPSAVNWQPRNFAKLGGELRRNSFSHLARGADGTLFFQWRQSAAGAERFHSAMLPHAGEDTKVFREVTQVGEEYQRLTELVGSTVDSQVALVYDFESAWAAEQPAHPTSDFDYYGTVLGVYRALRQAGVTVDVVPPSADLAGYRLVVVPALYQVTDHEARWLEDYVRAGGHAVLTWFSGIADENSRVRLGGYPGAFRELLGLRVEEFFPLPVGDNVQLTGGLSASNWSELLHTNGCEVVASYVDGPLPGVPAVTRNEFGDGVAWYLATTLSPESAVTVFADALAGADVTPVAPTPAGVEVVRRRGERISWLVAINHTDTDVVLPVEGVELISGVDTSGGLPVPAGGVAVVREV